MTNLITVLLFTLFLTSCGGGGGSNLPTPPTTNSNTLNIVAAPTTGTTCKAYQVTNGAKGNLLGTSPLSADGKTSFTGFLYTGNALIECLGGTYTDEATNTSGTSLSTLTAVVNMTQSGDYTITPLTHMAAELGSGNLDEVITIHNKNIADQFGLENMDITTSIPVVAGSGTAQVSNAYGLAVALISQMGQTDTKSLDDIVNDIVTDMANASLSTAIKNKITAAITAITAKNHLDFSAVDSTTFTAQVGTDVANDTLPPQITLTGSQTVTVVYGDGYVDAGSSVVDNSGESISAALSGATIDSSTVVGEYQITYTATDSKGNQSTAQRTVTVTPKNATVTANATSKTYGQADPSFTYSTSGLINGDTLSGALSRNAGENVGTYVLTQGTLANANYNLNFTSADITITKADVTVTANAVSKTYGDSDPDLTYGTSGLVSGDTLSGALSRNAGENVGTYAISQGSVSGGDNYNISFVGDDLTITQKNITVSAQDKTKSMGTSDPALTYTVSPALVSGDSFTGALTRAVGEELGNYAITQGTLALSSNYNITFNAGTLSITDNRTPQASFSLGGDMTIGYGTQSYTISISGNPANDVAFESSDENVAQIGMSSGVITIKGFGTTTITATSAGDSTYAPASDAIVLTLEPNLIQKFMGGALLTTDDKPIEFAFNTQTGKVEEVSASCDFGNSNSTQVGHYKFHDITSPYLDVVSRCGKGEVHSVIGSTRIDGQMICEVASHESRMFHCRVFNNNPDNPALGSNYEDFVAVLADIPLDTPTTLSFVNGGTDVISTRSIYNDGTHPAGTYEFTSGSNTFVVGGAVSVGDTITGCEKYHFERQADPIITYDTIECSGYGIVDFSNSKLP
jgi:hypothetical protein